MTIRLTPFTLQLSREGPELVAHFTGELDMAARNENERALLAAVAAARHAVLDLSELTFCDSCGLSLFFDVLRTAARNGTDVSLRNARPAVRRVIDIAGSPELTARLRAAG